MKTIKFIGVLIVAIISCVNFSNCSSDPIVPEITVEMGNENYFTKNMDFDSSVGEKTFSFNSNVDWTIDVAATRNGTTWCTVTPNSGKAGANTVRIKVQENTGYDDRNVVLTLTAGSTLTKTVTVTQKQKDALLLTTNKFEVEPQGGKINIEVKANVEYEVIVPETYKSWISQGSKSRGLTTSTVTFDIAETEEYDKREGEIIIKSGDLSETVHVYQTGQEILLLTKNEYPVSDKGETIAVEVKSNFTFDVQMPNVDWVVDASKSRGVSSHTLYYTIFPNETYDCREAEIIFYDKNSSIKDTLKIIQAQKDAIILDKKNYEVESKGGIIEVELNTNVDFDISIDSVWVKPTEQTNSRGLVTHKLFFQIDENSTYDVRYAHIAISDKNTSLTDTITICQAQKDTIIIEQMTFEVPVVGQNIAISIKTNIDYNIKVSDEYQEWIAEDNQTRGLKRNRHTFTIKKNKSLSSEKRKGHILVESKLGNDTILVTQEAPIYVEKPGSLSELLDKDPNTYVDLIVTGELNNKDFLALKQLPYLSTLDLENIKNEEMPNNVFEGKESLTKIIFPRNLIKIPDYVCHKCKSLVEIEYFEKLREIGYQSFLYCNLQGTLIIKDNITTIGKQAFEENKLDSIIIGSGLKEIKLMTFSYNRTLKHLELGDNIEILEDGCFNSCDSLSGYIVFPEKVKRIGAHAFTAFDPLKYIKGFVCKNPIPPQLNSSALPNYDYLQVPRGSKSIYEQTDNWKNFLVIEEVDF